jgi:sodium/proline symporter
MPVATLVTFIVYFAVVLAVGLYCCRKNENIEDYLLGGRRMGALVTAISAEASDMSGWLLMGLPGAVYLGGAKDIWIAIGLFIGTILNWVLVAGRLRLYTDKTNAITLPRFLEERFGDPTGLLRALSAVVILVFFTIYASSGLVAAGKLFESTFGVPYGSAVVIGGLATISYTLLGGYFAVCWTDAIQGMLMVFALVAVPSVACLQSGGVGTLGSAMTQKGLQTALIPDWAGSTLLGIVSAMAWGLGYFGQPHILARFMSVKSLAKLRESMVIAIVWVFLSLAGAVTIGLVGVGMFENLSGGEEEKVFIHMVNRVIPPLLAGIMLAAIMAAIMSTIDSQLLVSSSVLTEDLSRRSSTRDSVRRTAFRGRVCVVVISIAAMALALRRNDTILGIVAHAWGGFGAAFGPLVLFALFSRRTTWVAALLGMVVGTLVLVAWRQMGLNDCLYEIVPGFVANSLVILVVNRMTQQENVRVLQQFDEVARELSRSAAARRGRMERPAAAPEIGYGAGDGSA